MEFHELARQMRAASRQIFSPDRPDPRWTEARDLAWAAQSLLGDLRDFQARFRRENTHPVTYWDLIGDAERTRLENSPAGAPSCKSCGQPFKTDADFWKHYVTTDLDTPRASGRCWKHAAPEYAGRREGWGATCVELHCRSAAKEHDYGSDLCDWKIDNGEVSPKE